MTDEQYMKIALQEAILAFNEGEIPVGAIIISKGQIIAKAHNQTERLKDFTAHAEMMACTAASEYLGHKYLNQCTLYVTLEPCVMCAGALFWTQIGKVVFGATDKHRGFSLQNNILHPKTEIIGGVLDVEAQSLLSSFFKSKRK